MPRKNRRNRGEAEKRRYDCQRLDPEKDPCVKFDSVSIAKFPVAKRDEMGMRVLDNCAEEHIM